MATAGVGVAVDSLSEAVVTGWTYAQDFPTVNAYQPSHASDGGNSDGFVTKFAADGSALVFSTYLGGNVGDFTAAVAIDPGNNVYVTGTTNSANFPITPGAYESGYNSTAMETSFVSEIGLAGSLIYSTYFSDAQAYAIAVNASGNVFLTGSADKAFPVTPGAFQTSEVGTNAFVSEFNSSGSSLVYSTYLGGNDVDYGYAIALDSTNNAYVAGQTSSLNFPLQFPVQTIAYGGIPNAFVAEINEAGSQLLFSTFLGGGAASGAGSQQGNAIAVDTAGNIYVAGDTNEVDFPVLNAMQPSLVGFADAFVTKFLNELAPAVSLTPSSISFSPSNVGSTSVPQTITLTNAGNATLNVSAIVANGDFSQTNTCNGGIVAGGSCAINATFTPTIFGSRTGILSINSNATLVPEVAQLSGTGQDFLFAGSPRSATVSAGQAATVVLTLQPESGFAQQVTFSCSGAPSGSSCLVSPSSVTLNGNATATATMTVTTMGSVAFPTHSPSSGDPFLKMFGLATVAMLLYFTVVRNKRPQLVSLATIIAASLLSSCGGASGSSSNGESSKTPPGSYIITITATSGGNLQHSQDFTLTVN